MTEMIKKSDLLKAMARIQPSAENYGSNEDSDRNASVEDSAYWAARDMFDDVMFQIQAVTDAATEYVPVVHGRWTKDSDIDYGCSVCGRRQLWMNAAVYEYCPHCGAKMDERSGEK